MIVGLFPELGSIGGVQRAGRLTAAALDSFARRRGQTCLFLSLNDRLDKSFFSIGSQEIKFEGFHRSKTLFVKSAWLAGGKAPALVIVLHPNLAPIAAAIKLRNPNTRTAVVAHGIEVWNRLPIIRRRSLLFCDLIFAPSTDTAEKLAAQQGVPEGKIVRLPWSLAPDFSCAAKQSYRQALPKGFPPGKVILTVGRWDADEAYKGVDHLIEAMPALLQFFPDLYLVAVGSGTDVARLKSISQKRGVADRVSFLSALSSPELSASYEACDIFALPSRGEGFGLVFLEAMSHGKPVIGGAYGGTTDIIEDGMTGYLVRYGDVSEIVQRIAHLLKDGSVCAQMGANALERVRNRYTFAQFQKRFESSLDALLAAPLQ